jgi:hypothetical protein
MRSITITPLLFFAFYFENGIKNKTIGNEIENGTRGMSKTNQNEQNKFNNRSKLNIKCKNITT